MYLLRPILIIFLLYLNLGNAGEGIHKSAKNKIYRNFWLPMYHGERLNYCGLDNQECGMAVAKRYCRLMGYANAVQQLEDYNIGLTNILSSSAQCVGVHCNGFKTIKCIRKIAGKPHPYHYSLRRFVYPRFNNYRVAWCYDGKNLCGRRAAYSFCRRMGYLKAQNFAKQERVAITKAIANQKLCIGKSCEGFSYIICAR